MSNFHFICRPHYWKCINKVEHTKEIWVFTGDYKTEDDGILHFPQVVKCNTFITECTFGSPAFKWTPQAEAATLTIGGRKTVTGKNFNII
jgi:hypothetical protein